MLTGFALLLLIIFSMLLFCINISQQKDYQNINYKWNYDKKMLIRLYIQNALKQTSIEFSNETVDF